MSQTTVSVPAARYIPQGRLGIWILIAGELIIFGGLIACYLLYRLRFPEWGAQAAHTSTLLGAINTLVLLTSSYTIVRAHSASLEREKTKIIKWMIATISLGFVFLAIKTIEYSNEISHGFTLTSPSLVKAGDSVGANFWSFYYFMTGLHATHVIVGMIIMTAAIFQVKKEKNFHRVELAGLYWHMVDIIWIFLFPLLYIAK